MILIRTKDDNKQLWSEDEAQDSERTHGDEQGDGGILDLWLGLCCEVSWYESHPHHKQRESTERYVLCFVEVFREFETKDSENSGNCNNAGFIDQ